jgi:hypothetical protein
VVTFFTLPKKWKHQDSYRIPKVGTFTFWERPDEGMSGGSYTPPKKRGVRTREILEKGAKLVAQGRPDWPTALIYYPNLPPKEARQRYRSLKSRKHELFDALVDKYRNEYVTG